MCVTDPGDPPPPPPPPPTATPMQIYGVWHAGNNYADWSLPRQLDEFDAANHWIIDRGDGSGLPSVNLVVLSFLQPVKVLNKTNDAITVDGVPIGMTQEIVDYFKNEGIRVMMSIGGITYTDFWDDALATDPFQLGLNAGGDRHQLRCWNRDRLRESDRSQSRRSGDIYCRLQVCTSL